MSGTADTIGTGPGAWFGHIGAALTGMAGAYRSDLRHRRRRTTILTVIIVVGLLYPLLNQYFLEGFSRNVFPLPLPDATVMTFMTIFAIMSVGLNIVVGFAGLLDLGYVAFYAIGAYVAAFLSSPHWSALGLNFTFLGNVAPGAQGIHLPFWLIVPIAVLVVATFGALLGAPTLRLRGDYLAIVTLGFGEIVPLVFKNLSSLTIDFNLGPINIALNNVNLTGGVQGINPIDPPFLPFLNVVFGARSGPLAVYLGLVLLAVTILVARNLERSRIGRAWMAIREDETAAEMMGVNTVRTKLLAFALGASFAGIAGAFQASYLGATTSDFFDFSISILVLIMIILGGIGNIWGAIVGAFTLEYVNATLLPYLGQRVQDSAPFLAQPGPVQLPPVRDHPAGHDAVPPAGLPAEPPASGGAGGRRRGRGRGRDGRGRDGGRERHRDRPRARASARARQRQRRAARARTRPGPMRARPRRPGRGPRPVTANPLPGQDPRPGALVRPERPEDGSVLVSAKGVTKKFGGLTAVNNVDFDIPRGSIVSLIGPNGAGKTTFFNMITGYYAPTAGEITFDGRTIAVASGGKVRSKKPHEVTAMGIGRTFQNIRLFGAMSALDNVRVGLNVHLKSHWWDSVLRTPGDAARGAGRDRRGDGAPRPRQPAATRRHVGPQPALR